MAQIRGDCMDEAYRKSKNAWLDIVYHGFVGSLSALARKQVTTLSHDQAMATSASISTGMLNGSSFADTAVRA